MSPTPISSSRKRPYQPDIAAFFRPRHDEPLSLPLRESSLSTDHDRIDYTAAATQRLPPPHVQSNLINTGMRIRKALAGGYQRLQGKAQPAPFNKPASLPLVNRPNELQPYGSCYSGLDEVGGLSVQRHSTFTTSSFDAGYDKENELDFLPPSSQESDISSSSTDSTDSMPTRRAKRSWEEDDTDAQIQLAQSTTNQADAFRVMMKQRRWAQAKTRNRSTLQRQRVVPFARAIYPDPVQDFEEADFLTAREDMDLT